jgi:quercetin 2,3-dioxygenase
MIEIRRSSERGRGELDWLDARYSFSFASYFDPSFRGFRCLRVLNEDRIQPSRGFDPHSHDNMEIITYVVSGELTHEDSLGNQGVISAGQFQMMSAGSGVVHSEHNRNTAIPVHMLQMWITPDTRGLEPRYTDGTSFNRPGRVLVASPSGRDDSMRIHQDVELSRWELSKGERFTQSLGTERFGWVQVVQGELALNDSSIGVGDGAMVSSEKEFDVVVGVDSLALFFDLP